jgi:hypothetical protein
MASLLFRHYVLVALGTASLSSASPVCDANDRLRNKLGVRAVVGAASSFCSVYLDSPRTEIIIATVLSIVTHTVTTTLPDAVIIVDATMYVHHPFFVARILPKVLVRCC